MREEKIRKLDHILFCMDSLMVHYGFDFWEAFEDSHKHLSESNGYLEDMATSARYFHSDYCSMINGLREKEDVMPSKKIAKRALRMAEVDGECMKNFCKQNYGYSVSESLSLLNYLMVKEKELKKKRRILKQEAVMKDMYPEEE